MALKIPKRQLKGRVTVDSDEFVWEIFREPRWSSQDGLLGLTLSIRLVDHPRELILELPNTFFKKHIAFHDQRPKITDAQIVEGIRAAIAAGFKPASRGKLFSFCLVV